MRYIGYLLFCVLMGLQTPRTMPSQTKSATEGAEVMGRGDTEISFAPQEVIEKPLSEMRDWKLLSIEGLKAEDDRQSLFKKIEQFPQLTELRLRSCDLSKCKEGDPIPLKNGDIAIIDGRISQDTLRWLSKCPPTVSISFSCDLRGLDFSTCKFSRVAFDNCEIRRSAILPLVEKSFLVSFKEVILVDDKEANKK